MQTTYRVPPFVTEPAEDYHAKRSLYLTSHQLIDFRRCPAYYKKKTAGLIAERTSDAFVVGRAAHTLTLEGRKAFDKEFVVGGPINPKTGKQYGRETKAFAAWAEEQGKPALSDSQYELVCVMTHSVKSHGIAKRLLSVGQAEGVLRADNMGTACQIRVDWFSPNEGLVDLKTCDNLDTFEDDCKRFSYAAQMAFYRHIIALHTEQYVAVHLIAVEKREPYRCGVWYIDSAVLDCEMLRNSDAMFDLRTCQAEDSWPTLYEEKRYIQCP